VISIAQVIKMKVKVRVKVRKPVKPLNPSTKPASFTLALTEFFIFSNYLASLPLP